jgi:hypothetical protein
VPSGRPFLLQVLPEAGSGPQALEKLRESLTRQLAEVDVESLDTVEQDEVPGDAKGLSVLAGWIAVQVSLRNLGRLVQSVADWASRNNHAVEIRYGKDTIIVSGVTSAQQEKLVDEWLDRHSKA